MSYSDNCEDRHILSLFPKDYVGTAVEVGAGDGKVLSNTLLLEEHGWNVLCIEPNPALTPALLANRKNVRCCACLATKGEADFYAYENPGGLHHETVATVGPVDRSFRARFCADASEEATISRVQVSTLDALLEEWPHTDPIDLVSIDVDGREPEVMNGFDLDRWKPRYLLIEDIGDEDGLRRLRHMRSRIRDRGYIRIRAMGWNVLWESHQNIKERMAPDTWRMR